MRSIKFVNSNGAELEIAESWPFVLESIKGCDAASVKLKTKPMFNQNGINYYGSLLNPRYIDCTIVAKHTKEKDLNDSVQKLYDVFNSTTEKGVLTVTFDRGRTQVTKQIEAVVYDGPAEGAQLPGENAIRMHIGFFCPDPPWKNVVEQSLKLVGFVGGLTLPFTLPFSLATQGDIKEIDYDGTVTAPLLIEFRGPASMPKIWKDETGETIEVEVDIAEGESLFINTHPTDIYAYTVKDGVTTSAMNYVKVENEYFGLTKGKNTLKFSASSGSPEVYVNYRDCYIGA